MKNPHLILASRSPRRRYLLETAGLSFTVVPSRIDESDVDCTTPEVLVKRLAQKKASDVSRSYPKSWVIGADTIVLIHGRILGKPLSKQMARKMILMLSGETHTVYTGYSLCCHVKEKCITDAVKTDVRFKHLSKNEIEWYVQTDEPFDKAGGYAIQDLGMFLVKSIKGSYTNVVGLPICEIIDHLIKEDVIDTSDGGQWRFR